MQIVLKDAPDEGFVYIIMYAQKITLLDDQFDSDDKILHRKRRLKLFSEERNLFERK